MGNRLTAIVESARFRAAVMTLIVVNAVIITAETYASVRARWGGALDAAEYLILGLFVIELALRFGATSPRHKFFLSGWNWFDIIVIGAGFLPGYESLAVLRLLRIVRILRAVTVMPHLQKLVLALLRSLPSLGHIVFLLTILLFAYSAAGTVLFREADPEKFGSFHRTVLTMFTVMTLEGWPDVMYGVLATKPWAWFYFVSFLFMGTFISMNLFVGVIINNLQAAEEEEEEDVKAILARVEKKVDELAAKH